MREQHGVRRLHRFAERHDPPQMADLAAEERVGQEAGAVELDQRRRVPDVEDRCHGSGSSAHYCSFVRAAREGRSRLTMTATTVTR